MYIENLWSTIFDEFSGWRIDNRRTTRRIVLGKLVATGEENAPNGLPLSTISNQYRQAVAPPLSPSNSQHGEILETTSCCFIMASNLG